MIHNPELITNNFLKTISCLLPSKMPAIDITDRVLSVAASYECHRGMDVLAGALIVFSQEPAVSIILWRQSNKDAVAVNGHCPRGIKRKQAVKIVRQFLEAVDIPEKLPPLDDSKKTRIISFSISFEEN